MMVDLKVCKPYELFLSVVGLIQPQLVEKKNNFKSTN
jgi:hypothetical protein